MAFPHDNTDWASDGKLKDAIVPFLRISQAIAYSQSVYILCKNRSEIESLFCSKNNMTFIEVDFDDTWTRDYGALSIEEDGKNRLLDFIFDGWGGKFKADLDNKINQTLHKKGYFGITPMESIDFVLEGGSIESDGEGTILTTSSCLCNQNRNGGKDKSQIEEILHQYLGAKRVLWLENGYLAGDDTDSHIDTLARFVSNDTIVYQSCEDPADEHFHALKEMESELKNLKRVDGRAYNLISLPLPEPKFSKDGRRLPATYANFLITNSSVILPTYKDISDKKVVEIFKEIFPSREIIPIDASKLIEQGGSIHCSTMQIDY
jgi:agmatine deiminase